MTTINTESMAVSKNGWLNPRNWSLAFKLTVPIAVILILGAIALSLIVARSTQSRLTDQIGKSFELQAKSLRNEVNLFFHEKVSQIQALAVVDSVKEAVDGRNVSYTGSDSEILTQIEALDAQWVAAADDDPLIVQVTTANEEINPTTIQLLNFLEAFPSHTEIFVTDRYGATLGSTGRLSDYYQADEGWWQAAWNEGQGAVFISEPEFDESAGVTALLIAVPIYDKESGEVLGIVRSTLIIDELFEVVEALTLGESGHAVLFNRAGDVIVDPRASEVGGSANLSAELRQKFVLEAAHFELAVDENGDEVIFGHAPLHEVGDFEEDVRGLEAQIGTAVLNLGWGMVVRQEADEAFAAITALTQIILSISIGLAILLILTVVFVVRAVIRPIQLLDHIAEEVAAGNLDVSLPMASGDEVGSLAGNFGRMIEQLKQTLDNLRQETRESQQRALTIQISAEVSRRLSTILDEQELVATVVEQLQSAFNYYHAHIYLLNEGGDTLLMVGGTGEAGAQMLAQGHHIPVGKGLVGRTAKTNVAVLVPDVSKEADWFPNPLLPDTKAETAVPIAIGDQILGVLDVQHNIVDGLGQKDADLLQSISSQMAIALHNARNFIGAQQRVEQEALVNRINREIDAADTVEEVMQVTVRELGRALGADQTAIRFMGNGRSQSTISNEK